MLDVTLYRFQIDVADEVLDDLQRRLRSTRWPAAPHGAAWTYGTSLTYMRELVQYWIEDFDWRAIERDLNGFAHYRLPTDCGYLHTVIEAGSSEINHPIVLLHGWPGSIVELLPLVAPLAHPEHAGGDVANGRTVIAVSLPGYGFSDAPETPQSPREVASSIVKLVRDTLGFEKFYVHGGDWGAAIASWMAFDCPDCIIGLHLTTAIMQADSTSADPPLQNDEKRYLEMRKQRATWTSGYQQIQGQKPLSLAYGLTDSPAGLAAWILEKYQAWSTAQNTERPPPMDRDALLTIVTLYWLAGPGPASWMYRFLVNGTAFRLPSGSRIEVPTALCHFAGDSSPPAPINWQRRSYNVVLRSEYPGGSHFPGLSCPNVLAEDILRFLALQQR